MPMQDAYRERLKDLVLAVVLVAIGIGGFLFINPQGADVTTGPGGLSWRSLPFIYSGLLIALSLIYGASTAIGLRRAIADANGTQHGSQIETRPGERKANGRRVATLIALVGYALALPLFGFAIATPLLLLAMFVVLGREGLASNIGLALFGGFLLWLLFVRVLKLPLRGDLWDPITPILSKIVGAIGL